MVLVLVLVLGGILVDIDFILDTIMHYARPFSCASSDIATTHRALKLGYSSRISDWSSRGSLSIWPGSTSLQLHSRAVVSALMQMVGESIDEAESAIVGLSFFFKPQLLYSIEVHNMG